MILTNEQRAHDYALTVLIAIRDEKIEINKETGNEDIPIDMFDIYLDTFNRTLEKLNNL